MEMLPVCLIGVKFQTEIANATVLESPVHHIQRGFFSATKSILFPRATAAPITLAMVWDLPVPGGPWTTSRLPVLIIRVYNSGLEGVLGSGGFDAEAIHGGVSSG